APPGHPICTGPRSASRSRRSRLQRRRQHFGEGRNHEGGPVTYRHAWKALIVAVPLAVGISVVAILLLPTVPPASQRLTRDTELPPSIPPGMRAVAVNVDQVIGAAGFVVPGTRVDVLVTKDGRATRVAVSNVQVLTGGTRYQKEYAQREGKPISM